MLIFRFYLQTIINYKIIPNGEKNYRRSSEGRNKFRVTANTKIIIAYFIEKARFYQR